MNFKKFLNNPWTVGIATGLIVLSIPGIYSYVSHQLEFAKVGSLVVSFFSFKFPVWMYFSTTLAIYLIVNFINNRRWNREIQPDIDATLKRARDRREKTTTYLKSKKYYPEIFYSSKSPEDSYQAFGRRLYNPSTKQEEGIEATGSFHVKDNILTVERTNVQGRFIINICKNYFGNSLIEYVPKNLYGKNPRCIKFKVLLRCSGGSHKIFFVIKKYNSYDWLNNVSFDISSAAWEKREASFNIPINEDFQMQMQIFNNSSKPEVFQVQELIIEEV